MKGPYRSIEINFSLPDYGIRREFIDKSAQPLIETDWIMESCEIKEAGVRDENCVAKTTVMPFWNIANFFPSILTVLIKFWIY